MLWEAVDWWTRFQEVLKISSARELTSELVASYFGAPATCVIDLDKTKTALSTSALEHLLDTQEDNVNVPSKDPYDYSFISEVRDAPDCSFPRADSYL